MTEEAQPEGGQGPDGNGGLFDSYLQSVPEEHREVVGGYLADAAKNVNGRLEEAAALRTSLAPYQEAGITNLDPQGLRQLVDWYSDVTSDDDRWKAWVSDAAQQAGLSLAETQQLEQVDDDLSRDKIAAMVTELAQQQVAPLQDWVQQQEFNQIVDQETSLINGRLDALQAEHKRPLSDEEKAIVLDLGSSAMPGDDQTMSNGHDWVGAGWERFQKLAADAQKAFVDTKLAQPAVALAAGGTAQTPVTNDWKTASDQALERLRQSRST